MDEPAEDEGVRPLVAAIEAGRPFGANDFKSVSDDGEGPGKRYIVGETGFGGNGPETEGGNDAPKGDGVLGEKGPDTDLVLE